MKDALITLTVLASLTSTAVAKGNADPKLPKEVQPIHCMVGTWQAKNVQVTMAGKKTKGELAITCNATSGGFGVVCTSKITVEGLGTIEETDLFGWDPQAKLYHWYAVTSMGDTHDHIATVTRTRTVSRVARSARVVQPNAHEPMFAEGSLTPCKGSRTPHPSWGDISHAA